MAINQIIIGRLKYIFYILLILFLIIYPVSASDQTFYFNLSSTSQNDEAISYDVASGSSVISYIKVNDMAAFQGVRHIILDGYHNKWGGPAGNSEWAAVEYKIGSTVVATGTFGFNKGDTKYYVGAFFNEENQIFDQYSGTQYLTITGSYPSIRWTYSGTLYDTSIGSDSDMGYMTIGASSAAACGYPGAVGSSETTTTISYDFSNKILYDTVDGNYNLWIEKLGQNSKYNISNSYEVFFKETSVNTNDQHIINTDTQNYTWLVKAENAYGDLFSKTVDMSYDPQTEDTIVWGADSYVVDDTGSYTWSLSDSNWDTVLYSKKASIYRDETMVHEVSLTEKSGTGYYTFEEEGSFTVKLRHTSALLPHETIDTDTVNVLPAGDSYIHVNNTIVVGQHFDIDFSYGFTPKDYFVNGVKAKYFHEDSNEWLLEKTWGVSDLYPMTANTIYQVSGTHTINFEGDYIFELYDFDNGVVATTPIITAIFDSTTPTLNISTSYINISKTDYVMGEIMDGFYGIDNDNYTYNNYLVVYNYQHDTTSMDFPLIEQASGFYGTLVQTDIHGDWIAGGEIPVIPGNNKISIYAENSTTRFEVVYVNFTISAYDEDGYGLQLSTYDACINEEVLISVISPADANLTIFSPTGMPIKTYTLNGSTTIKYWFPTSGMYSLELYKSGEGISRATVTIYISDCADDGIIEPPSGEMDDMYINMFNAMTLPAFWGMIIFIGFIGGLAIKRDKNGDALVSGNGLAFIAFGLLNLLSIIGLFAPYTFYIIVSTWIFAGMFFGVGRYLARGEG